MIIIGFVLLFFYIDEDQDSPSSQANTAEGKMGYVLSNLYLVKMLSNMLFVTEFYIRIHVA